MRNLSALILAYILALGVSGPLVRGQVACPPASTTTIYLSTTVYAPSPASAPPQSSKSASAQAASICIKALTSPTSTVRSSTTSSSTRSTSSSVPSSKASTSLSTKVSSASSIPSVASRSAGPPSPTGGNSAGGKGFRNIAYFTNWGIYGRNYQPQDLPADQLTHVLHAFANVNKETGTVYSSDTYADLEKHYATDSWNDGGGKNAYGIVKQLYIQKKRNRGLKTLLSVGGWTYSANFMPAAGSAAGRREFARSAVALLADWGLDGIDVDWEYPRDAAEAAAYVQLLRECRAALDDFAKRNDIRAPDGKPYHFLLTVATAAGPANYKTMDLKGMDPYVDTWHLMAYDYAGSWSDAAGHAANIFASSKNPKSTPFSTDAAVRYYLGQGIRGDKILLGLPLYGRAFESTSGPGTPFSGVGWAAGADGNWEAGVWDYRVLPRAGATERWDDEAHAAYSYDPGSRELISYDNVRSATDKAAYIRDRGGGGGGLGGAFFWEASGDRRDDRSLIKTMATKLGKLETSQNNLKYPTSQYENIRKGMPS